MPNNRYDFSGRVALVTGGGSGIGAATVGLLREGGACVAAFDLHVAEGWSEDALFLHGDVTDSAALDAAVARVLAEYGRLDILVCAAGIPGEFLPSIDVSDEEWNRVLSVNASGTFFACRAAIPPMVERGYGRIVNVASIAGKEGNPKMTAYSASKAAVICLTKSLGKELAQTGVLVNCIAPGATETPMAAGASAEQLQYVIQRIPLGRMAQSHEVAALIGFLASEDLAFSTGATFDVSGGRAVY